MGSENSGDSARIGFFRHCSRILDSPDRVPLLSSGSQTGELWGVGAALRDPSLSHSAKVSRRSTRRAPTTPCVRSTNRPRTRSCSKRIEAERKHIGDATRLQAALKSRREAVEQLQTTVKSLKTDLKERSREIDRLNKELEELARHREERELLRDGCGRTVRRCRAAAPENQRLEQALAEQTSQPEGAREAIALELQKDRERWAEDAKALLESRSNAPPILARRCRPKLVEQRAASEAQLKQTRDQFEGLVQPPPGGGNARDAGGRPRRQLEQFRSERDQAQRAADAAKSELDTLVARVTNTDGSLEQNPQSLEFEELRARYASLQTDRDAAVLRAEQLLTEREQVRSKRRTSSNN